MKVKELIDILNGLEDEVKEFFVVMTIEEDSETSWSLDQISVAFQRNSHPPRGFVLFESVEVKDDSVNESEDVASGDGSVPGTPVGESGG